MAGTNAAAAKTRLVTLLTALPALADVQVAYSLPRDLGRECVYLGRVGGPVQLAAMRPAGGRLLRTETLTLNLHIRVQVQGAGDTGAAETSAVTLGTAVEELVAGDPTLSGLPDLKVARIAEVDLNSGVDDEAAYALLTYAIELVSQPR